MFASAILVGNGDNQRVSYGDDKGLLVEFEDDAIYQEFESVKAGRAIYKQVPFIRIIVPGDKTKQKYKPATEADKVRFPMQWAAYERGEHARGEGTPITEWIYLSKSQALELKHMGFWTVELLANASDTQISGLIGGMLLRNQACEFLKGQTKLSGENEDLKAQIKALQEKVAALQVNAEIPKPANVETPKNKGGRPKKATKKATEEPKG